MPDRRELCEDKTGNVLHGRQLGTSLVGKVYISRVHSLPIVKTHPGDHAMRIRNLQSRWGMRQVVEPRYTYHVPLKSREGSHGGLGALHPFGSNAVREFARSNTDLRTNVGHALDFSGAEGYSKEKRYNDFRGLVLCRANYSSQ